MNSTSTLSNSDYLGIVLSLVGVIIGIAVSWVFFRAQQKTDFRKISESIDSLRATEIADINESLAVIRSSKDIQEQIGLKDSVSNLKEVIARLDLEIHHLPAKITAAFSAEQLLLLDRISERFNRKVDESTGSIEASVRKAISKSIPASHQAEVLRELTELLKFSMMTMGKYQLEVIRSESERTLSGTAEKVMEAVSPAASEVEALQATMMDINHSRMILPRG